MWKIVILLILGISSAGCSVIKIKSNRGLEISKESLSEDILESTKNQNITNENFFIQKTEIEIITQNGRQKLIGSAKFLHPDKYLISLKGKTGIEGARIFISGDTILVNDRLNKKVYKVSPLFLKSKYGISKEFLPLIFGDLVLENKSEGSKVSCNGDKIDFSCTVQGLLLRYELDCKKGKTILVKHTNSIDSGSIEINYDNIKYRSNLLMPEKIEIVDSQRNIKMKIRVVKIQHPWNGKVEFVPGKDYEIIELL